MTQEPQETVADLRLSGPKGPLTQVEAAQAAGVSQKQVSQIEMGKVSRPHPDTLRSLATAFGVDVKRMMSACRESYRRAHPEPVEASSGQPGSVSVSHTPSDSDVGGA